ncbi:MAG: adhesin transport system outer membrane protein [Sulfurimonas sp.]|jgi:adhesin transport system outer membrane protein
MQKNKKGDALLFTKISFIVVCLSLILNANDIENNKASNTNASNFSLPQYKEIKKDENIDDKLLNFLKQDMNIVDKNASDAQIAEDQKVKIELIDAVLQTLSTSNTIKANREKMIQAKYNIDIAYGDYLPSLDLSYSYSATDTFPGDQQTDQSIAKDKVYNDEEYSVVLTQNLYAGGQTSSEIKRLQAKYLVAKTDFERLLADETTKAITAYIDVVFSRESMQINDKNIKLLEIISEIVQAKYDAGALSIGELSNMKASVSNAKSAFSKTNSTYSNALEYFKFITGELFEKTFPYEKVLDIEVPTLDDMINNINNTNLAIKSYNYSILDKKYGLKKLEAPFKPKVNLSLEANKITDQEDYDNIEDNLIATIEISYNLFNGNKDQNRYLKAYSSIKEIGFEKEKELRKIKWELEKYHTSITSQQDNLNNIKDEVISSNKMVSSYWESFRSGEQDLNTLLQGQRQLNTAELSYIKSQQDTMKDYFKILELTGKLLPYFEIDVNDKDYLNMAKSNYRSEHRIEEEDETISKTIPIDATDLNVTKEEILNSKVAEEKTQEKELVQIQSFYEKFLTADENKYTVVFDGIQNPVDGLKKISDLNISKESFLYNNLKDRKVKSKVAFGIFNSKEDANASINSNFNTIKDNNITITTTGEVQKEFKEFSELRLIDENNATTIINSTIIKEIIEEKPFRTNAKFKEDFLNAPKSHFTINLTTVASMKKAGEIVKKENIDANSFVFKFKKDKDLYKLMYGLYPTYKDAKLALDSISIFYLPIIERVFLKQELYNRLNEK